MSDITMCSNENCDVKETCKRHNDIVNKLYQSCADFGKHCNIENGYDFKEELEINKKKRMWEGR